MSAMNIFSSFLQDDPGSVFHYCSIFSLEEYILTDPFSFFLLLHSFSKYREDLKFFVVLMFLTANLLAVLMLFRCKAIEITEISKM